MILTSIKSCQQRTDFIGEPAALGCRKVARDRCLGACRQVIAQHICLHPSERGDDGAGLMRNVDTIASTRDHLLETPDLPFYAPEARQLLGVINFYASMILSVRTSHFLLATSLRGMGVANGGAARFDDHCAAATGDGAKTAPSPQISLTVRKFHVRALTTH